LEDFEELRFVGVRRENVVVSAKPNKVLKGHQLQLGIDVFIECFTQTNLHHLHNVQIFVIVEQNVFRFYKLILVFLFIFLEI
jgi:hypothetical protein